MVVESSLPSEAHSIKKCNSYWCISDIQLIPFTLIPTSPAHGQRIIFLLHESLWYLNINITFKYFYLCVSVCVCVCMHVSISVCMHLCMWRPRLYIGCLSLSLFTLSFEKGSLIEPGPHQLARLAGQQTPGILLFPNPQHWDYRNISIFSVFYMSADFLYRCQQSKLRSSCLQDKRFTNWAISLAPIYLCTICVFVSTGTCMCTIVCI